MAESNDHGVLSLRLKVDRVYVRTVFLFLSLNKVFFLHTIHPSAMRILKTCTKANVKSMCFFYAYCWHLGYFIFTHKFILLVFPLDYKKRKKYR